MIRNIFIRWIFLFRVRTPRIPQVMDRSNSSASIVFHWRKRIDALTQALTQHWRKHWRIDAALTQHWRSIDAALTQLPFHKDYSGACSNNPKIAKMDHFNDFPIMKMNKRLRQTGMWPIGTVLSQKQINELWYKIKPFEHSNPLMIPQIPECKMKYAK